MWAVNMALLALWLWAAWRMAHKRVGATYTMFWMLALGVVLSIISATIEYAVGQ